MSGDTQPVSVRILDKDYLVACPEDERDALEQTARYLDRRMREIRDSGKIVGVERIAVMAALNITHEMLQHRSLRETQSESMSTRIRALQEKIEVALHQGKQMEF
ncbi:MAG: cell division protein ZapA [Gammaproteobacteria bacterium]|nr:cell division protein ZapA [Gammaproteobacteria bacterium]NIR98429.1 cell division protein ZapA [Gammaproteobacteria bacterium]NIT64176.1 cell division protein ZapA [Gammaproteobacteria bacterium]NIV21116.1 cell division protein ZapA [Gammaproteobacteria bacterium]NIX10593.1 cell division protein ZapA [Gammaproteobacteria bacterium]